MKHRYILIFVLLEALLLVGCTMPMTPMPAPTPTRTLAPTSSVETQPLPEEAATLAIQAKRTLPAALRVEPTFTPYANADVVNIDMLPIGEAGHYVSLVFGYWVQYPPSWYTGFGNRPLLVSFSNLDPRRYNRGEMRDHGCLIEINASVNIPGLSLSDIQAQLPRILANAEAFELDGEPALRIRRTSEEQGFESDWVYVEHGDRLFLVSAEYDTTAGEICRPAWERLLATWKWIQPEFAVYRNTTYGYSFSAPRHWYRFNALKKSIWISSEDPAMASDLVDLARNGMLVMTQVYENPNELTLEEWIIAQERDLGISDDIPLEDLMGVRIIRQSPGGDVTVQEMSGYYKGPLGRIYEVTCLYPAARQWEFRPIANAILYSFGF